MKKNILISIFFIFYSTQVFAFFEENNKIIEEKNTISQNNKENYFIDEEIEHKELNKHFNFIEPLSHDTKIRNKQLLKNEQDEIIEIIGRMNELERELIIIGEEKEFQELKTYFTNKYLILEQDQLIINNVIKKEIEQIVEIEN